MDEAVYQVVKKVGSIDLNKEQVALRRTLASRRSLPGSRSRGASLRGRQVEKIVLGISEGKMGEESREFGRKLEKKLKIPMIFQDETLTTHEAQKLSIEAGMKRKKRKTLEDAFSATLILQAYLDEKKLRNPK
jgi:RNase H-fold protein (predicted Holliday junction resolvase)